MWVTSKGLARCPRRAKTSAPLDVPDEGVLVSVVDEVPYRDGTSGRHGGQCWKLSV